MTNATRADLFLIRIFCHHRPNSPLCLDESNKYEAGNCFVMFGRILSITLDCLHFSTVGGRTQQSTCEGRRSSSGKWRLGSPISGIWFAALSFVPCSAPYNHTSYNNMRSSAP